MQVTRRPGHFFKLVCLVFCQSLKALRHWNPYFFHSRMEDILTWKLTWRLCLWALRLWGTENRLVWISFFLLSFHSFVIRESSRVFPLKIIWVKMCECTFPLARTHECACECAWMWVCVELATHVRPPLVPSPSTSIYNTCGCTHNAAIFCLMHEAFPMQHTADLAVNSAGAAYGAFAGVCHYASTLNTSISTARNFS